jgi:hypothetical protein
MPDPNPNRRRKARSSERRTPCECCGFPLSQRHHLLPVACYGESEHTIQLCANCHELFHLIFRGRFENFPASKRQLGRILLSVYRYENPKIFAFLYQITEEARDLEIAYSQAAMAEAERIMADEARKVGFPDPPPKR